MPSEIASIDAATGGKEAEIFKLTALSGRYEIVLANPKSDLPNFHLSDTLYASSAGGTTKRSARYVCHRPTLTINLIYLDPPLILIKPMKPRFRRIDRGRRIL